MLEVERPSAWMVKHAALVPAGARLLDVAAGRGRNAKFFASQSALVTAVDRDEAAMDALRGIEKIDVECRDLELAQPVANATASAWPYAVASFDAVIVCNYLWRPTLPALFNTVNSRGVLLYETFLEGNERYGKPSRPDFLLKAGELAAYAANAFDILDMFEGDVLLGDRIVARKAMIAARRRSPSAG